MSITGAKRHKPLPAKKWVHPVPGHKISTPYGQRGSMWSSGMHTGADFAAPAGKTVHAVAAGRVTQAGPAGAYGTRIVVSHAPGFETWYCHLSEILAGVGSQLGAGAWIGKVGSTGNTTGPHLHLEVRVNGVHRDPAPYLSGAQDSPSLPTFPNDAQPGGVITNPAVVPSGVSTGDLTDSLAAEVRRLVIVGGVVLGGVALVATGVAQGSRPRKKAS
ncbi:hypothetical protein JOE61_003862 [Nocardioides salarius]|uniref:M23ase beta-sheet core domain-containing protein n=1 Tax=Nocardioides salarius TaxID=374513 RepID=A0ABS2MFT4_9ACTN|nr:M23 family metallopeptidase [Nocardioides salarius]MBM7510048.1 hypothetical protein [Nocardioides salarius]